jgi:hypothetical protein
MALAPCFWQERLQAGDLSSHIYNTWLAQAIGYAPATGLSIASQNTNVLFDLLLSALFRIFGPDAAQRGAVSLAVLVVLWGSFSFVTAVSGRKPWTLLPCLLMLAYGWVFHMGFCNYYLSLGLCFWALALIWASRPWRITAALPILALAYLAHALPVAWSVGIGGWMLVARALAPRWRALFTGACAAALGAVHAVLAHAMYTHWTPVQFTLATGLDQLYVFDGKYALVLIASLGAAALLVLAVARDQGAGAMFSSLPFQLFVLASAAVVLLPGTVFVPGYRHALSQIAERLSFGAAVCGCALVAQVRLRNPERIAVCAAALAFFAFLYADEHVLNRFEDRMQAAVAAVPPGRRVVSAIWDSHMRINALTHMIDRVCIGRCYSYANYEASTGQFRVRATAPNPMVVSTYADSWRLQTGAYVIKDSDLPVYQVDIDRQGHLVVRQLPAGTRSGTTDWQTLPDWLGLG